MTMTTTGMTGSSLFYCDTLHGLIRMEWTLTPLHEVLTERQVTKALKDTQMSRERMPLLKYSDAAIQSLIAQGTQVKVGDIIRITRHSLTATQVYYYRRVVA